MAVCCCKIANLVTKSAVKQVIEHGIGYSKKCFIFEAVEMEAVEGRL